MRAATIVLTLLALGAISARTTAEPSLTIYNQNFAVVRDVVPLNLQPGANTVAYSEMTAHVQPDSVVLRDPAGIHPFQILEQNYLGDPLSQAALLTRYEGEVIEFQVQTPTRVYQVQGKIIRSGYAAHLQAFQRYGPQYAARQMHMASGAAGEPIVEVDGQMRFGLPGIPLFPSLGEDALLKPTIEWRIGTEQSAEFDVELSYLTGGMSWKADYNLIGPAGGDTLEIIGWVTLDNQSGKTFENARVKLVAGDVNRVVAQDQVRMGGLAGGGFGGLGEPPVTERTFDEYHMYTLQHPSTVRDRETKQVEFLRAAGVASKRLYVYDGLFLDQSERQGLHSLHRREDPAYGNKSNPKVWVMREFRNSAENNLGIALPQGVQRFYREDEDGQLEFVGENMVDHTPKDEMIRVYTGNAFDIVGERRRVDFQVERPCSVTEALEITLRNHKEEPVEVLVQEHLYRWSTWEIAEYSQPFEKKDSDTIEFVVQLEPGEEQQVLYTAHYSWCTHTPTAAVFGSP